ncbi:hypothetical protein [Streptomyces sp. x-80]|uniref:hypothetical protein n=1 Tax=Streptomyces sp. x-80 TaxID=2789282 RepID=UPI003980ACF0
MPSPHFPHDLVQLQHAWNRTYAALAVPRSHNVTALRRELQRLSVRLVWHPFFNSVSSGGPAARAELRRQVRAYEQSEARASWLA